MSNDSEPRQEYTDFFVSPTDPPASPISANAPVEDVTYETADSGSMNLILPNDKSHALMSSLDQISQIQTKLNTYLRTLVDKNTALPRNNKDDEKGETALITSDSARGETKRNGWLELRDPQIGKRFWYHIQTKTKVWYNPHRNPRRNPLWNSHGNQSLNFHEGQGPDGADPHETGSSSSETSESDQDTKDESDTPPVEEVWSDHYEKLRMIGQRLHENNILARANAPYDEQPLTSSASSIVDAERKSKPDATRYVSTGLYKPRARETSPATRACEILFLRLRAFC
jgi:hypothetical protein